MVEVIWLSDLLSDKTTVSEEALLYWLLTLFQGQWLDEINDEEQHKKTLHETPKMQQAPREAFLQDALPVVLWHGNSTQGQRTEDITGREWDEVVSKEADQRNDASSGTVGGQLSATDATAEAQQNPTAQPWRWKMWLLVAQLMHLMCDAGRFVQCIFDICLI